MTTFAQMKNRRTDFNDLQRKMNTKTDYSDDRFWYPQRDEAGNARAVIRFLPHRADSERELEFVQVYSHGFKDVNGSFYQNCRTTLNTLPGYSNEECPVCQANQQFFEQFGGYEKTPKGQQETRRKYFRRMQRISNIYVVDDPKNPENNGKVFLFRYGQQIIDLILAAITPQFEGDPQFDPFDMWTGANFEFRITKKDGRANYETSRFAAPGPMLTDDDEMERIWNSQYTLEEFIADDQFKSYADQVRDWNRVTGGSQPLRGADDPVPAAPTAPAVTEETPSAPATRASLAQPLTRTPAETTFRLCRLQTQSQYPRAAVPIRGLRDRTDSAPQGSG